MGSGGSENLKRVLSLRPCSLTKNNERDVMSYVDNNLLPQEQIDYRKHLHWIIYLAPAIYIALGFAIFIVSFANKATSAGATIGGGTALLALVNLLLRWMRWKPSEF